MLSAEHARRTRIRHRDFVCNGADHHVFRAAVKTEIADDGQSVELSAQFQPFGTDHWSALPVCPFICGHLAEERETYDPSLAAVAESERIEAWLSPDGQRVAIPGKRGARMPERYVTSGYRRVEASSMRDVDRLQAVRARQTDNEVVNEMNWSAETRRWHDEAPYDPDSMTSII